MTKPFLPTPAATVNIDVSASSQAVSLAMPYGDPRQVRIMNNGTATAWVNFGTSAVTAALASGFPVGPGVTEVITIPDYGATPYAAAIAVGSTGKIYFTPGDGI